MTLQSPRALHFIEPDQLNRISNLELLARTVVEGFLSGLHRSPHSGVSIEFAQYRPYTQGDSLKFVDWKLYGRTDRLHVKQFHEETNLRCTLLIDCSGSMDYGSIKPTKFEYARMLAACLTKMLSIQKDAVGLITYHEQLVDYIPPRGGDAHLRRILTTLQGLQPDRPTDTAGSLKFLGDIIKPRGMVILISDLLHPLDQMMKQLRSLRARRHDVLVFQLVDPAEAEFPFDMATTFIDAESGDEQFALPEVVRKEYLENRRKHFDELQRECTLSEIDLVELRTHQPLDHALHSFIHRRNRALMTSGMKRGQKRGGR